MKRPKIVIVGGGSVTWTPRIVRDMFLTPSLSDAEYVLYDIRPTAAKFTARFLERLKKEFGCKATITPTDDREKAFRKADYFLITISTGRFQAMAHDLAIPEDYGIYHTVGDTCGPGGWARSIRNFDTFVDLGRAINRFAPGAMVLNYTNPMTVLTNVLCNICDGPVVGLCHGVFENLEFLKNYYHLKDESEMSAKYSGLNHFFWITEIRARGRDLLADLRRRIATKSFEDLGHEYATDEIGFWSRCDLATDLFRLTGVMPYIGDRHTCEFMPPYLTNKRLMKKYRLARTSIKSRRDRMQLEIDRLKGIMKQKELPETYRKRTRETAADIISAHIDGRTFVDVGNLPNVGQMQDLPLDTVVETPVLVDRNGFTPVPQPPLPELVVGMLEPCARAFDMTAEACFTQDRELALHALHLDPLCAHLDITRVREMGERLLHAHRKWISL